MNNIRLGTVKYTDWEELNARVLSNLSLEEKDKFDKDDTILLTETWQEAYERNSNQIKSLNTPVAVIPSCGRGSHHSKENDMGQIRNISILAKGIRVMITKNQELLATIAGLNNGAVGKVIDIYYDEGVRPPNPPAFVVVDIPGYKGIPGNVCIPGYPTYVPLTVDTGFCDMKCCQRTGYPLIPAYGITIMKAQGMTIGKNELIKKCVIKLNENTSMEARNLGLAYTAFSRVCEFTDLALHERIPWERLEYTNHHKQMKSRKDEEHRLKHLEQKTLQRCKCSEDDYITLLRKIDDFCKDGICDSVCYKTFGTCTCIYHNQ